MLKAMLKKDIIGFLAYFLNGKDGKRRSPMALMGFAVLFLYGFGAMAAMFWMLSKELCAPLAGAGLSWVYFALLGLIASMLGIFGGVFTAKSKIYEAKDNELLLSLPIPAKTILFSKVLSLYLLTFLFEALVFLPALIVYISTVGLQFSALVGGGLVMLIMPLGALALGCLLGFGLTWLTSRLPFKNLFSVVGMILFFVVYFLVYSKANDYLTYVLAHGEAVGAKMKTVLFPFAQLGKAASGNWLSLFWFALMFIGLFLIVYEVLSLTFIKIATTKRGERYAKYKASKQRSASMEKALLRREFLRFIKSPSYLLNAAMGTLMMLIFVVMTLVHGDVFGLTAKNAPQEVQDLVGLIVSIAICFMCSSNGISACSVSLEGNALWVVRSLPVKTEKVLFAKWKLHFYVTFLGGAACGILLPLVTGLPAYYVLLGIAIAAVSSALFGALGLVLNLKFPNLQWLNETAAVKQGISTMLALVGGWGIALLPIGGYFLFGKYLPVWGFALICLAVFMVAFMLLMLWVKKRGVALFERL